ncbi:MAG: dihydroorotate dehydrogenase [Ilumatobacteraceae bacterium]
MTSIIGPTVVGSVKLKNPILTASGTSGHGAELNELMPLAELGGVVVKSLAAFEWPGNRPPRLYPLPLGMLNSVGLQGDGIKEWLVNDLPQLVSCGATVIASIWGRSVDDYARAAEQLAPVAKDLSAVEVNLSCPNVRNDSSGSHVMFAHDEDLTAQVIKATAICGVPRWAKLSSNTDRLVQIAGAAYEAGAEAVTLINTILAMVLDTDTGLPVLGSGGGGGLSGRAIHPIAVRTVFEVAAKYPDLPIVGVGGVASGRDAAELMCAGASAVQVGTATFAEPGATLRIVRELVKWAESHAIREWSQIVGVAHRGGLRR